MIRIRAKPGTEAQPKRQQYVDKFHRSPWPNYIHRGAVQSNKKEHLAWATVSFDWPYLCLNVDTAEMLGSCSILAGAPRSISGTDSHAYRHFFALLSSRTCAIREIPTRTPRPSSTETTLCGCTWVRFPRSVGLCGIVSEFAEVF